MFLSNKNEAPKSLSDTAVANRFNKGTTVTGDIRTETDLRIEGIIKGEVTAVGKVVIGQTGEVYGNINAGGCTVEGKLIGNVYAKSLLIIKSTAKIEGDLIYKKLVVEEGALIKGSLIIDETNQNIEKERVKLDVAK